MDHSEQSDTPIWLNSDVEDDFDFPIAESFFKLNAKGSIMGMANLDVFEIISVFKILLYNLNSNQYQNK